MVSDIGSNSIQICLILHWRDKAEREYRCINRSAMLAQRISLTNGMCSEKQYILTGLYRKKRHNPTSIYQYSDFFYFLFISRNILRNNNHIVWQENKCKNMVQLNHEVTTNQERAHVTQEKKVNLNP